MARRRQKKSDSAALIGLLLLLLGFAAASRFIENLPQGTFAALGLIIVLGIGAFVAFCVMRVIWRMADRREVLSKTRSAVERQLTSLVRRRMQLVRADAYGKLQTDGWAKEVNYFIKNHIQPGLTPKQRSALARSYSDVVRVIGARVEEATKADPMLQAFDDAMTPAEFETFCAEQLRLGGWDARVTLRSRDQGVDVIAEKDGTRVVVQCKLYARPVGNKSVQEVAAARAHEQAHYGAVVTNSRYTTSAEELAGTNRILLLHYRDLRNLDSLLASHFATTRTQS